MAKTSKKLFHNGLEECTFNFEVPGETLIALHNALSFTIERTDEYSYFGESSQCPHCPEAMHALRQYVGDILKHADLYKVSKKKLN